MKTLAILAILGAVSARRGGKDEDHRKDDDGKRAKGGNRGMMGEACDANMHRMGCDEGLRCGMIPMEMPMATMAHDATMDTTTTNEWEGKHDRDGKRGRHE